MACCTNSRRWPAFALDDDFLAIWEPAAGYLLVEKCVRAHADVAKRHGARFEEGGWDMTGQLRAQMEGRIDSWALRFSYAKLCADAFTVLPTAALAANIGNDGTGVHCFATDQYDVTLAETAHSWDFPPDIGPDPRIMRAFHTAFRPPLPQQLRAFARRQVRRLVPTTPRG